MNEWAIILSITSILFTGLTAVFSILSYAKVVGMEKSTHQVQWVDMGQEIKTGKELEDQMHKAFGFKDEDMDSII